MDGPARVFKLGSEDFAETMGRFPFLFADLDGVEWTLDTGLWFTSGVVGRCSSVTVTAGIAASEMLGWGYRVKQFAQLVQRRGWIVLGRGGLSKWSSVTAVMQSDVVMNNRSFSSTFFAQSFPSPSSDSSSDLSPSETSVT